MILCKFIAQTRCESNACCFCRLKMQRSWLTNRTISFTFALGSATGAAGLDCLTNSPNHWWGMTCGANLWVQLFLQIAQLESLRLQLVYWKLCNRFGLSDFSDANVYRICLHLDLIESIGILGKNVWKEKRVNNESKCKANTLWHSCCLDMVWLALSFTWYLNLFHIQILEQLVLNNILCRLNLLIVGFSGHFHLDMLDLYYRCLCSSYYWIKISNLVAPLAMLLGATIAGLRCPHRNSYPSIEGWLPAAATLWGCWDYSYLDC